VVRARPTRPGLLLAMLLALSACGSSSAARAGSSGSGSCAGRVIPIVVSVAQWSDIVHQLAGSCGDVTTVLASSSIDPHDYEPTPADLGRFQHAQLVVLNGLGYDAWASKAVAALEGAPAVVDGGDVVGRKDGDNPHIWYGPAYVNEVADAVTAELVRLRPSAAEEFKARRSAFASSLGAYGDEIRKIRGSAAGMTYAATESVFDDMADAVGLTNKTPRGFQKAAANESEPAPGDVDAFQKALADTSIDVLVYNTQTQGSIPEQIRSAAKHAGVPIVDVTETPPPGASGFVDWQLAQLERLAAALGSM
jgi:zinc/manganese transport system substrate-binding protein